MTDLGTDARRLVVEIIATLVNIKSTMAELLLEPAGVPREIFMPLLNRRDEGTGKALSKRQIAPLILDALDRRSDCSKILRSLIEIASCWNSFHLAHDEFVARATVQKARELLGTIELMEAREAKQRELARQEQIDSLERERAVFVAKQHDLLLLMFEDLAKSGDPQRRGYLLQDLMNRLFDLNQVPVTRAFTRNQGAEQIDGAIRLEGWHYLVECRWREKLADIRQLDGLKGQVDRSGKQAMGLFVSINGWSNHVPSLLKQNPEKSIVLMDGYDLRCVLSGEIDLREFLTAKVACLNLEAEPFLGASQYLKAETRK